MSSEVSVPWGEHYHHQAQIKDMDCVSTAEFDKLKAAVEIDARNLDVAWIILCSKYLLPI
jgi:hypothetical protein